jgi:stage II sporulation protein D
MKFKWTSILVCLWMISFKIRASESKIAIRLFSTNNILSFNFFSVSGQYVVVADGVKQFETDNRSFISLTLDGDSVWLQRDSFAKKFGRIKVIPTSSVSEFKLTSLKPALSARSYNDELIVSAKEKTLLLINKIEIEKYVAGVIQWEVGLNKPKEFNKVKAIAIRTYALGNWRRHEEEGFQLCDEVHCQVFKGKTQSGALIAAAKETTEYILVDDEVHIVTAAFHSNCGGQTMNSEEVWSKAVVCLRSVNDTFCIRKTNAVWQKKIPKDIWLDYLRAKYSLPMEDETWVKKVLHFEQPNRAAYLLHEGYFIPLKFIREDMKLKSTFFTIKEEGDNVVFSGKGFGHGVGLCQEGAMRMAELGYSYIKILNYYYAKIHLIRYSQLDFFQAE